VSRISALQRRPTMAVYVPLPGSKRTLLPNSRPAGPVDPSEVASLTVRVRSSGDPDALAKQVYEQASQPLANRTYLTREELAAQHGASKDDLDKIEALRRSMICSLCIGARRNDRS